MKIFISHSNKDKEKFIDPIVKLLYQEQGIGKENVFLDEKTFALGKKINQEIEEYLDKTDLFVIFLSNDSVTSPWVRHELEYFKKEMDNDKSKRKAICPIIIDKNLKHDDERIPNWLREYNIKPILQRNKIINIIKVSYFDLNYGHKINEKTNLFVGRNEYLSKFEERMDSFDKLKPTIVVASGFNYIGRKTLLEKCLLKSNIIKKYFSFPKISFSDKESIEDLILKLIDLGLTEESYIKIAQEDIQIKENMLKQIIYKLQNQNEIIMIEDNGGIIDFQGNITEWFINIIKDNKILNQITFCIVSKFRFTNFEQARDLTDKIFSLEISELNKIERNGLLKRYIEQEKIELDNSTIKDISELLTGYPTQVFYIIDLIKLRGIQYFKDNSFLAIEYAKNKSAVLLKNFEEDSEKLDFIILLSKFDYISVNFLINNFDKNCNSYINEFILVGICEYFGVLKEYIRLNDIIKDYVLRTYHSLSDKYLDRLEEYLNKTLENLENESYNDIPELLFSLKELMIKKKNIDNKFLIPSVYLKSVSELYNRGKHKDVIEFCKKALENEKGMENSITLEIRYFLCLSLAKLRDKEFLKEVQKINGANHSFLFGFYYRQIGKFDKAIESLDIAIEERRNFSKAKREKVQCYIGMREFDKALQLAEENYNSYSENPYHIQAYFSCLVKSDSYDKNKKESILKELIKKLENSKVEFAREMSLRCNAQMQAFYYENYDKAISYIENAINKTPDLVYGKLTKFDICEKFNDLKGMNEVYKELCESKDFNERYSHTKVIFNSLILAKKDSIGSAKSYFNENIRYFTEDAKKLFLEKLENKRR